jgi:predicted acetyltransferase
MSIQIRPVSADEIDAFLGAVSVPFGFDPTPEAIDRFRNVFELERMRAAVDGGQIVATFGTLTSRITVPGGVLPLGGTTIVTVLPTHRRRGVFRRMMTEHLAELHRNKEPLAALWASESSIYGRFGYGPACEKVVAKIEKPYARLQQPVDIAGTMKLVDREEAQRVFPTIYDAVAPSRPGLLARNENWWRQRVLRDPEYMRRGGTAHRRVLHVRDGQPAGYVIYRTRMDAERGGSEIHVLELIAIDAAAEQALWQFLFGIDLSTSIEFWNQSIDDPLRWWLEQPRRLERKVEDGIWLRVVDVAAALSGRRYSTAGSLILRVEDAHCPWNEGCWQLTVGQDGVARCQRSESDPEIELDAYALGMIYLGGHRFAALARSGLVTGEPEAIRRADALFSWDIMPTCADFF